jgi:hypothetical protein
MDLCNILIIPYDPGETHPGCKNHSIWEEPFTDIQTNPTMMADVSQIELFVP